jgi:hypothetical protein
LASVLVGALRLVVALLAVARLPMRLLALAPMGLRMVIFIVIILLVKNTFDVLADLLEEIHVVC